MIPNANNFKFGSTAVKKLYQGSTLVWPTQYPTPAYNQVVYISTDGNIVEPASNTFKYFVSGTDTQDCSILSNVYTDYGVITCDSSIEQIGTDNTYDIIATSAFANCTTLQKIILPATCRKLSGNAFFNCGNLSSINIDNIIVITFNTFSGCGKITEDTLNFSQDLRTIGHSAFDRTGIKNITLSLAYVWGVPSSLFRECRKLETVTITSSIYEIGSYAFYECEYLTSVTLPSTLFYSDSSIGAHAFAYCTRLSSITIPDARSSLSIGTYAFYECRSLTSVTIPSHTTSIGLGAFRNCTSLTSVTVQSIVPPTAVGGLSTMPANYWKAFDNTNNCPIYVPAQSVNAYKAADGWSDYANRIQAIPS